jgi:hypothetical protein
MTCIVAIGDPISKITVMGGDRAVSDNSGFIATSAHPKVFVRYQYLFGYAGSIRFGKLIQYGFEPPVYVPELDGDLDEFMNTIFCPQLKSFLEENQFEMFDHKEEIGPSVSGLIVGIEGRIFEIEYDLAAIEYADNYAAIGSASEYAVGALSAYKNIHGSKYLTEQINGALRVAAKHSTTCSAPFDILTIGE